jgi:hypothetical protein
MQAAPGGGDTPGDGADRPAGVPADESVVRERDWKLELADEGSAALCKQTELFSCQFCFELPWKPVWCTQCGALSCQACERQWDKACPSCKCAKRPQLIAETNKIAYHLLSKLRVKCPAFASAGCLWAGFMTDVDEHLDLRCPFAPTTCDWCNSRRARHFERAHADRCPDRPVACEYCHELVAAKEMAGHVVNCDLAPKRCAARCGWVGPPGERRLHEQKCELIWIECHISGCGFAASRKNMAVHAVEAAADHLRLQLERRKAAPPAPAEAKGGPGPAPAPAAEPAATAAKPPTGAPTGAPAGRARKAGGAPAAGCKKRGRSPPTLVSSEESESTSGSSEDDEEASSRSSRSEEDQDSEDTSPDTPRGKVTARSKSPAAPAAKRRAATGIGERDARGAQGTSRTGPVAKPQQRREKKSRWGAHMRALARDARERYERAAGSLMRGLDRRRPAVGGRGSGSAAPAAAATAALTSGVALPDGRGEVALARPARPPPAESKHGSLARAAPAGPAEVGLLPCTTSPRCPFDGHYDPAKPFGPRCLQCNLQRRAARVPCDRQIDPGCWKSLHPTRRFGTTCGPCRRAAPHLASGDSD